MRRVFTLLACLVAVMAVCCYGRLNSASAYLTFRKAFEQKYVGDATTDTEKSMEKEVKRVKCFICHDPRPDETGKTNEKNRNPYGQALNKHLSEKDKKDLEKAVEMLVKVEGEKAEGSDKTFGELIKSGKAPFEYKDVATTDEDD